MRRKAALPALALALAATMATAMPSAAADGDWTLATALDVDDVHSATYLPAHPAAGGLTLTVVDGLWHLLPATLSGGLRARDDQNTVRLSATPADAPRRAS